MQQIPLATVPNQSLAVTLEDVRFVVTLKEARGVMVASITADGAEVLSGSRVLAGEMLIPYRYRETAGNFLLLTSGGDLPAWAEFGGSQTLVYLTSAELGVIRG